MKRSTKMILLLLLAAAMVCGYLAVQTFTATEPVDAADVDLPLFADETVTGLAWTTAAGDSYELTLQDGEWTLPADPAFPLDTAKIAEMAGDIAAMTAQRELTGVQSYSDYGLAEPSYSVEITLESGATHTLSQGSENALSGLTYVRLSGSDSVYMVSQTPQDILEVTNEDLQLLEALPEIGDVMTIALSSHNTLHTIALQSEGVWVEQETGSVMDAADVESFIEALNGMEWSGLASYTATADDHTAWLLDDPVAKVVVAYTSEVALEDGSTEMGVGEFTLIIGDVTEDGENVYAAASDGSAMVYTLSNSDAQTVFDALQGSLESTAVIAADWNKLQQLTVSMAGGTLTIDKTVSGEGDAQEVQWQIGGNAVDADLFARLQDLIDGMTFTKADAPCAADEYLTLTFSYGTDGETTLTFTDESADSCGIAGEAKTVSAADIDEIIRILRHLV